MRTLLLCLIAFTFVSCASAPPTLSPAGQSAFQRTRLIKALDLLRDAAIDGNKQTPPLFSTATTRKVVTAYRSAILVINASQAGWQSAVSQALGELVTDKSLLPEEVQKIAPYITFARSLIGAIA